MLAIKRSAGVTPEDHTDKKACKETILALKPRADNTTGISDSTKIIYVPKFFFKKKRKKKSQDESGICSFSKKSSEYDVRYVYVLLKTSTPPLSPLVDNVVKERQLAGGP